MHKKPHIYDELISFHEMADADVISKTIDSKYLGKITLFKCTNVTAVWWVKYFILSVFLYSTVSLFEDYKSIKW